EFLYRSGKKTVGQPADALLGSRVFHFRHHAERLSQRAHLRLHACCFADAPATHHQINPFDRKEKCFLGPMMTWSCTSMPSGLAAATICRVTSISALLGLTSPLGWLCTKTRLDAPFSSARFTTSRG